MKLLSVCICLLTAVVIRADSDIYIPLKFTNSSEVGIAVSIDGIQNGEAINRPISFGHTSLISFQSSQVSVASNRTVSFRDVKYAEPNIILVPFGRSVLGIGPGSGLMRSYGPMAIVNNTWLIVNSTEEYFNQLCLPESISRLSVSHTDLLQGLTFQASLGFVSTFGMPARTINLQVLFRNIAFGLILEVPERFRTLLLVGLLEFSDLTVNQDNSSGLVRFDRCPTGRLPSIAISIENKIRLLIHSQDYLKEDAQGCSFLVGQSNSEVISLNPFLLNGVNFRVDQGTRESDGHIQFCDSQDIYF